MSYPRSARCVACEARNKKCDGTGGCTRAGVEYGGYFTPDMGPRAARLKHNVRGSGLQTDMTYQSYVGHVVPKFVRNEILATMTSSTGPPLPNDTSLGHLSTISAAHNHDSPDWSAIIHGLQQETRSHPGCPLVTHGLYSAVPTKHTPTNLAVYIPTPSTTHTIAVESQTHTPPTEGDDGTGTPQPHAGRSMVAPSQASVSNSAFRLTRSEPIAPPTPESPESQSGATHTKGGPDSGTGERLGLGISSQSQADSTVKWPASSLDDEPQDEDSENIEAVLLNGLVPDCQVESNAIPYIVHCFASTVIRFTFEPTRIIPALQGYISHAHSFGYETWQNLLLISNILLAVSKSTDYDLTDFTTLQNQMVRRVVDARAQAELTRDSALVAMEHNHEFISTLWRVGSLANVMSIMDLYAPVFRRACPEPGDELVNLPRRLTIPGMNLKYYVILDVLQSFITHRPMFFRYDLEYLSPEEEALVKSDYGPGLRWLYGVPDQLMITLARMNTLFEVHGNRVDPATVLGLEGEIEDCALVVDTSPGIDPTLNIGRATVQQSWKMAATIYLYMGLCGANSTDARVVQVRKKFMRLLRGIKSLRNPDSFLVLPMVVLGVATTSSKDRATLLSRLWGVSDCTRPGTVGNDLVRILNDIWAHTTGRPAVWTDLKTARFRVTGK